MLIKPSFEAEMEWKRFNAPMRKLRADMWREMRRERGTAYARAFWRHVKNESALLVDGLLYGSLYQ